MNAIALVNAKSGYGTSVRQGAEIDCQGPLEKSPFESHRKHMDSKANHV
jgi:hypothetical protein